MLEEHKGSRVGPVSPVWLLDIANMRKESEAMAIKLRSPMVTTTGSPLSSRHRVNLAKFGPEDEWEPGAGGAKFPQGKSLLAAVAIAESAVRRHLSFCSHAGLEAASASVRECYGFSKIGLTLECIWLT